MPSVLVVSRDADRAQAVASLFPSGEFAATATADLSYVRTVTVEETPDVVVVDETALSRSDAARLLEGCRDGRLPTVSLVAEERLADYAEGKGADEFLLSPPVPLELVARVRRLLWRIRGRGGAETIRAGNLLIDQSRYEVSLAGRRLMLTFKEYELLRLMASNPGRVFTREALLSQVWGYDYFGGTRTVDVHVRRLRSKVEDAHNTFIETVWNVGYRFRAPAGER